MFLTLLIVLLIVDTLLFVNDRYFLSIFIPVGLFIGYIWIDRGIDNIIPFMRENILPYLWQYVLLGIITAILKWVLFVYSVGRKLTELSKSFNAKYRSLTSNRYQLFLRYVQDIVGIRNLLKSDMSPDITSVITKDDMDKALSPKAIDQADRITSWVIQWPIVVLSVFIEDVLLKMGEWVSNVLDSLFSRFTKYVISDSTKSV